MELFCRIAFMGVIIPFLVHLLLFCLALIRADNGLIAVSYTHLFIKENRPCFYTAKMIDGTWLAYLEEIDTTAKEMVDRLIKELVVQRDVTEELKADDQFAWISAMEQINHTAEEIVFENIVYAGCVSK